MREAWRLVVDYCMAIKGTIVVRARRIDPRVGVALLATAAVSCLLAFSLVGSRGPEQAGSESVPPDGVRPAESLPDEDSDRTLVSLDVQRTRDDVEVGAAGAAGSQNSPGGAGGHDVPNNETGELTAPAPVSAQSGDHSSESSETRPPSSPDASPSTTAPSAGVSEPEPASPSPLEPEAHCDPTSGLVAGLVGGVVCLLDHLR